LGSEEAVASEIKKVVIQQEVGHSEYLFVHCGNLSLEFVPVLCGGGVPFHDVCCFLLGA
jgi:hypothetical protein